MSFDADRLYELLPAVHRIRDAEEGEPLRALLSVIAEQVGVLEADLDQLYDDQFIETCAEWVTAYIGDLIGYRPLHGVVPRISSPRADQGQLDGDGGPALRLRSDRDRGQPQGIHHRHRRGW